MERVYGSTNARLLGCWLVGDSLPPLSISSCSRLRGTRASGGVGVKRAVPVDQVHRPVYLESGISSSMLLWSTCRFGALKCSILCGSW